MITAIFTTDPDPTQTSANLQEHLLEINTWTRKWKLKINESKSSHISFVLRQGQCPPVQINQTNIPQTETVKYLGIHFDRCLTWKDHVQTKHKQLEHKTTEIKWLIGRHSPLSLENKIIIYKTVLKPVWTYGIELWGCASNSNIEIIQWYQSKILRILTNAPWYFFVNKTSLMQIFRYLLHPSQLYMFRMLRPFILRSTVMYRREGTVYHVCKHVVCRSGSSSSWNSTPKDTPHAHIYCTFPPVHNCAPEDGWT